MVFRSGEIIPKEVNGNKGNFIFNMYTEIKHKKTLWNRVLDLMNFIQKLNHQKYFRLGFLAVQFLSSR